MVSLKNWTRLKTVYKVDGTQELASRQINQRHFHGTTVVDEIPFIIKGAGLFFGGTILSSVLGYIFEFIIARSLGSSAFGVFFIGVMIFKIMEKMSGLELTQGLLRFIPLSKGEAKPEAVSGVVFSGLKIGLLVSAILSFIVIAFSPLIAREFYHTSSGALVLRILSLGLVVSTAVELLTFSFQALGMIQYRVLLRMVFEPAASVVIILAFLPFGLSLSAASVAMVAPIFLSAFFGLRLLGRLSLMPISKHRQSQFESKKLLAFSLPLFLTTMISFLLNKLTPLMFGYLRSSQEVGLYAVAFRTSLLLSVVLDAFNAIFASIIADLTSRQELGKLQSLFQIITKWAFSFSLPFCLLFLFFGREVLILWGQEYEKAFVCLLILSAAQMVNCGTGPVGNIISMSGRSKVSLANASATLLLNFVLNLIFIPRYGILGAAFSFSLALSSINLARLIEVWLILKIHPYRRDFLKPLLCGLLSSLIVGWFKPCLISLRTDWLRLLIGGGFLFIIYFSCFAIMGIGEEEKAILRKIKQKISLA